MNKEPHDTPEQLAQALALMVAADQSAQDSDLRLFDLMDAYGQIGISRERFQEIVQRCCDEIADSLQQRPWLHLDDKQRIDAVLDAVQEPAHRLMVCALAARAIAADGQITDVERAVYEHMLGHWHINRSMVSEAILKAHLH